MVTKVIVEPISNSNKFEKGSSNPEMLKPEIEHEVRAFLANNFLQGRTATLDDDSPLLGNVIDSQGVIELVTFLQDRYVIVVEDEEVNTTNLDSLKKVVAFVENKLART
jgi:acyl carrier protein